MKGKVLLVTIGMVFGIGCDTLGGGSKGATGPEGPAGPQGLPGNDTASKNFVMIDSAGTEMVDVATGVLVPTGQTLPLAMFDPDGYLWSIGTGSGNVFAPFFIGASYTTADCTGTAYVNAGIPNTVAFDVVQQAGATQTAVPVVSPPATQNLLIDSEWNAQGASCTMGVATQTDVFDLADLPVLTAPAPGYVPPFRPAPPTVAPSS